MLNEQDAAFLELFGGPDFARKVADSILGAVEQANLSMSVLFDDLANCEALGEVCRSKVNENIRQLAKARGMEVAMEKPSSQRYRNVLISVPGARLTVSRGYGLDHAASGSGFKRRLSECPLQMSLDLFGEGESRYRQQQGDVSAAIIAWGLETMPNGIAVVSFIELQEVLGSIDSIQTRVDLLGMHVGHGQAFVPNMYDDSMPVTPKRREKASNA